MVKDVTVWYGLVFIVNQKWKKKILQTGESLWQNFNTTTS